MGLLWTPFLYMSAIFHIKGTVKAPEQGVYESHMLPGRARALGQWRKWLPFPQASITQVPRWNLPPLGGILVNCRKAGSPPGYYLSWAGKCFFEKRFGSAEAS